MIPLVVWVLVCRLNFFSSLVVALILCSSTVDHTSFLPRSFANSRFKHFGIRAPILSTGNFPKCHFVKRRLVSLLRFLLRQTGGGTFQVTLEKLRRVSVSASALEFHKITTPLAVFCVVVLFLRAAFRLTLEKPLFTSKRHLSACTFIFPTFFLLLMVCSSTFFKFSLSMNPTTSKSSLFCTD